MVGKFSRIFFILPIALVLTTCSPGPRGPGPESSEPNQIDLFISGQGGYHTYRIPSLIVTSKGTLLAFCEARKNDRRDSGDIDLVLKRSFDNGSTWGPMQIIADDGPNTMGNPCPVIDRETGTIWLPITRNLGEDIQDQIMDGTSRGTREAWMMKSTDDGATWSKPVEITSTTKQPDWTWYATGPGNGIQLQSGRMLIPSNHAPAGSEKFYSHVIYSDDHGATWKLGGAAGENTSESQVVELRDGSLLMNMRSYHGKNRRAVSTSRDGGLTWSAVSLDAALIEPVCQGSLIRLQTEADDRRDLLLFSNPASTERDKLTVRLSYDGGKSWPVARQLHAGPSAYSALAALPGGDLNLACLYERGEKSPYETITLARFSQDWLTRGTGEPGE